RVLAMNDRGEEQITLAEGFLSLDALATAGDRLVVADAEDGAIWEVLWEDTEPRLLWAEGRSPSSLVLVEDQLWFTLGPDEEESAGLHRLSLDEDEEELVAGGLEDPGGLAVTQEQVYIADRGQGELLGIDPVLGTVTVLADPFEAPQDVVWTDEGLYFTARSPNWPGGGWVYRVGQGGGTAEQLSYSPPGLDRLAVTADHVYWSSVQSITRAPREGGSYEILARETRVGSFLVQSDRLVWTDRDRGQLLALPLVD
ncbi:MAG: hypothetical protein VX498_03430, partial [Myxococcota bacterium]|nr:hypothetical protein [Myxococcota bacterium]